MITLVDGPAKGSLLLYRGPRFLRAVVDRNGKVDALDQLDDTPASDEVIHVYEIDLAEPTGQVHLNFGSAKRGSGFYAMGTYRHRADVDGESVRDNMAWQQWARSQPVDREIPPPKPTPHELWEDAGGDRDRYLELMREHGHIVEGKRPEGEDVFGHRIPERGR